MKKMFFSVFVFLSATVCHAFDFDGISLNDSYFHVAQEISKRGYAYDAARDCLKGNCQGTEIYLNINYKDVSKKGKVGQLIVEVPIQNEANALEHAISLFNVVYHQASNENGNIVYDLDKDGTTLQVTCKGKSLFLTYNTPYYKKS